MPRDTDKHNDPRGRRERPEGGKGRSGKPRGPEKKFAKRGFGPKRAEGHGDKPRFGSDREQRPSRRADEAPQRFERDERRPKRFDRDDRPPRRDRDEARSAGRFQDRKFRDRDGERDFKGRAQREFRGRRQGREFAGRDRSEDKPWQKRDDRRGGGDERPRFSRPREDREGGERQFRGRPKSDRPREDRGDRPKFERSREDRPKFSRPSRERDDEAGERRNHRPKFDRPGRDRNSESGERRPRPEGRMGWQEHPRSERRGDRFTDRPRRDNEDDSRIFAKRPAFGGRGAYRDRPDFEKRPRPEPKPKKSGERIAKVLARAGLASRRDAEEMVTQGRVTVNGRLINSPALDVTANDVVAVDGKPLPPRERTRLFLYHKPKGLMTTHADPEGRPTVFDNLPEGLPRLISVGRLDFNTEGLLLLTNDGGLARVLELPDTGWLRRYRVRAHGEITQAQLDELKSGIEVEGIKYGPIDATLERDQGANVWLVFAIREGKNREVRNVMGHLGLEVNRLIRISYGPFQLGEIEEGKVEEVRTRVLRDQLGEKVIAQAGCDVERPEERGAADEDEAPRGRKPFKPAGKSALVSDRKGRRVLVQRSGSADARARNEEENAGYGPPRRPKRDYHGKRDLKPRDE
ncbi:MAG: pseudouridine synthase [Bradyrhizobium sp.]|nr:pseudouridine synthase [Bradyrhizobium sp.]